MNLTCWDFQAPIGRKSEGDGKVFWPSFWTCPAISRMLRILYLRQKTSLNLALQKKSGPLINANRPLIPLWRSLFPQFFCPAIFLP